MGAWSAIPTNDTKDFFAAICNVANVFSPLHVCTEWNDKVGMGIHYAKSVATEFIWCCDCESFVC